ncbi:MAG: hypothetical protein LBT09_06665 [Planctomycetaceae bacterium]|jgi:hypothetical protein|nr:hypothetical protein [Planctomycetaceae bacterium]
MDNNQRYGADLDSVPQFGVDEFDRNSRRISQAFFLPIILASGLITTSLVFVAVYFINLYTGHNLLGFLLWFVLPIGAIGCGAVGGIGYAVSSRILQFLPNTKFIVLICVLQLLVFVASRYSEYTIEKNILLNHYANHLAKGKTKITLTSTDGEKKEIDVDEVINKIKKQFTFVTFYRATIEEAQWTSAKKPDVQPYKLGKLGWLVEIWTAVVFAFCSNVPLFILASLAYCKQCRRFMRKRIVFTFPARAPVRKINKNDNNAANEYITEDKIRLAYASEQISDIEEFLRSNTPVNRAAFFTFLSDKQNTIKTETADIKGKIPNTMRIVYSECCDCDNFMLIASLEINPSVQNALQSAEFLKFYNGIFVTEFTPITNKTDEEIVETS